MVTTNPTYPNTLYLSAPLPFVGQKRMFAKHFIEVIKQYPSGTVFVDLFGGSGLLSHITKHFHPESRVIYNDFDNYRHRIGNIDRTNRLLSLIRPIASQFPRHKPITGEARERIFNLLEQEERESGYIDYSPCPDYLAGLEIESCDYRELFERFKETPGVVFLVDPPYLSTDVGTYRMYWRLADYLDVLSVLPGHNFIYFTSEKSCIVELCEWMGRHPSLGDPFARCQRREFNATMNYNARYTDIMLFTIPDLPPDNAA